MTEKIRMIRIDGERKIRVEYDPKTFTETYGDEKLTERLLENQKHRDAKKKD